MAARCWPSSHWRPSCGCGAWAASRCCTSTRACTSARAPFWPARRSARRRRCSVRARPGPLERVALATAGRHRRPSAGHRQARRTPSCWPSRCCCSARRPWPARWSRPWRASARSAVTYAIGMRGWGPARGDPGGDPAGDLGPAPGLFARAAGRGRRPVLRHPGVAALPARAHARAGWSLAGLVWGVAFACNNRLSYLPAVFFVAELARWPGWPGLIRRGVVDRRRAVWRRWPRSKRAYLVARGIGRAAGARTDFLDYAQQLVGVHAHEPARSRSLRRMADVFRRRRPDGRPGRAGAAAARHRRAGLAPAPQAVVAGPTCCWLARCWCRWRCTACTRRAKSACATSHWPAVGHAGCRARPRVARHAGDALCRPARRACAADEATWCESWSRLRFWRP